MPDTMPPIASPELKMEIKKLILETLKISDVKPEDIDNAASLFENNPVVQLDSVDALEIVMALQRAYGVHIDDQNIGRFIIRSVDSIAEFVAKEKAKANK
ncbi:MAG TPA: phosphopantetheine-binding protein [Chitinivibrionales bacterium]|jgi:acyl carrier protein|nr:phosphopantetheine-binding protein [Chitinivibrionales bacterium]